jgi:starch synthase
MRIVLTASEAAPFARTGGLADVVSALGREFDRAGHDVTLMLPFYPRLVARCRDVIPPIEQTGLTIRLSVGLQLVTASVWRSRLPGRRADVLLIDQPEYFARRQPYQDQRRDDRDYADNCERFSFFCRGVVEAVRQLKLEPDVVQCHDWQTALVPALVEHVERPRGEMPNVATVLAIHNLEVQGRFSRDKLATSGLDEVAALASAVESGGEVNLLRAGIQSADQVVTVSPTYAREVQSPELGHGLHEVLRARAGRLAGILNGVDSATWNPATDRFIARNFSAASADVLPAKAICKTALQERVGLPRRGEVPVLGVVSRLVDRKGIGLLLDCAEALIRDDVQLVVLGQGEKSIHSRLAALAERHPSQISLTLARNESLAHQIIAGADLIVMPSRTEPAGLNQLLAQTYGTPPIVRATGGLADSVVDATPSTLADGTASGFAFEPFDPRSLTEAVRRAMQLYRDRAAWSKLVHSVMQLDRGWARSAEQYLDLYDRITARCRHRPVVRPVEYTEERIAV